ncbi:bifunctional DNA-formamidopyrimidine glycosylase/DNA-(apurinic or apyrimidinic site) lyase [Zhihengliuella halotolerans]|uniref:DNA-(Apurinic or apyrimidinic site) lyase n=1 Tax=Zhihengliuella halotolerans TaxID=370736 RepID=A0A4Q8AD37_9MICC|nr:bifunctional DNA-formamidopyrimidine glycosylase/DNA-(apurinic or apyrimidinic site) lyase [Zhihengliuella halotolerans]RZU61555.1 DNA-(apurinic or apyrimidinic site) lyase [Zhihengliuella halotolerans]
MPELPEAEVVRRGLARWVVGRRLDEVTVLDARSLRRHDDGVASFVSELTGSRVLAAVRRGKFLWFPLAGATGSTEGATTADGPVAAADSTAVDCAVSVAEPVPRRALVAHLGMSGQLLMQSSYLPEPKHLKVRLRLDGPGPSEETPDELRFVDQRIFGGMYVADLVPTSDAGPGGFGSALPVLPAAAAHIARDVLDPAWSPADFHRALTRLPGGRERTTGIKRVILDQGVISGVGNIYADEALWEARLHYDKPAARLRRPQSEALLEALIEVMQRALDEGGTSFDSLYVNVNGESGYFARSLQAYGREGQPCRRCARPMVREAFMGRSSYRCTNCQRRPRLQRSHSKKV